MPRISTQFLVTPFFRMLFFVGANFFSSCLSTSECQSGICISFDDRTIHEWNNLSDLFDRYDAKVTFFVTQFDSLDEQEIQILKNLKAKGHEIGSHGANHVVSQHYISKYGYKKYLQDEVDRSISSMALHNLDPTSFSYPYGAKYWFTDILLLKRFKVLRSVAIRPPGSSVYDVDEMFASEGTEVVSALGFDYGSHISIDDIKKVVQRAVEEKKIAMLYAHYPGLDTTDTYTFDVRFLEQILSIAKDNSLRFYRISELAE